MIIQSAGDQPTHVQTNTGAFDRHRHTSPSPTTPFENHRCVGAFAAQTCFALQRFLRQKPLRTGLLVQEFCELCQPCLQDWCRAARRREITPRKNRKPGGKATSRAPGCRTNSPTDSTASSARVLKTPDFISENADSPRNDNVALRLARRRQVQFRPGNLARRLLQAEGQQGRGDGFLMNRKREFHASCVDVTQGDLSNGLHKFHLSVIVCGHSLLIAMLRPEARLENTGS